METPHEGIEALIARLVNLSGALGLPDARYAGDIPHDAATLRAHAPASFVSALHAWGTEVYLIGLEHNPWKSLERFVASNQSARPGVRFFVFGVDRDVVELDPEGTPDVLVTQIRGLEAARSLRRSA